VTLDELLAPYRAETNTRAAAIAGDERAVRLLAAWSAFPVPTWSAPASLQPTEPRLRWQWIWTGVRINAIEAELAAAAGVPVEIVDFTMRTLIALRLVFPDGSISESAEALLMQRLDTHTKRQRGARK
jgi:hypothetical protein